MKQDDIMAIRKFNRFYVKALGLLNKNHLSTILSMTESRILFEIGEKNRCYANDLVKLLNLDKGHISRILAKLDKQGYISKQESLDDNRRNYLFLTELGKTEVENINQRSNQQISQLFNAINDDEISAILAMMQLIEQKTASSLR